MTAASGPYVSCPRRTHHEVHEHEGGTCTGVVLCEHSAERFHCDRLAPHKGRHAERWVASWAPDGTDVRWCTNSTEPILSSARPQYRKPFASARSTADPR